MARSSVENPINPNRRESSALPNHMRFSSLTCARCNGMGVLPDYDGERLCIICGHTTSADRAASCYRYSSLSRGWIIKETAA